MQRSRLLCCSCRRRSGSRNSGSRKGSPWKRLWERFARTGSVQSCFLILQRNVMFLRNPIEKGLMCLRLLPLAVQSFLIRYRERLEPLIHFGIARHGSSSHSRLPPPLQSRSCFTVCRFTVELQPWIILAHADCYSVCNGCGTSVSGSFSVEVEAAVFGVGELSAEMDAVEGDVVSAEVGV